VYTRLVVQNGAGYVDLC